MSKFVRPSLPGGRALGGTCLAANRIDADHSNAECGLRLRHGIKRESPPYMVVPYNRKVCDAARYARAYGQQVRRTSILHGSRRGF
ncbi:copper resistance protein B [Sphingobium sp. AR-3-1]|uniref:Copper resistance protein B n=2 Tax=Sphingobium psychrophilum TaxID=2728834 RepID=A0A7X9X0B2_9SPHN|nr:copper resistance protein B [Sphingobium psychrophilum]